MKRISALWVLFLVGNTASAAVAKSDGYNLNELFEASLKRSEAIGIQTELVNQAEEKYSQAKAAFFPTISATGIYLLQQSPSATATTLSPAEQTTAKITASQPLFRGMAEYASLSQQNLQVTAQISAKRQAAAELYASVVSNFYSILSMEQILKDFQEEITVYEKRISDLNARIKIGRSKMSEALTVRSALDTLAAQAEEAKGQLSAAREAFAFLTGLDRNAIVKETDKIEIKPDTLDNYLKRIEERPDVKSARDTLEAVEKGVEIARAGHFPTLSLAGNYYFKRPGIAQNQNWDASVTATLPLFSGGLVNAQVRQAAAATRQSDLTLAQARRLADQEIRTGYSNLQSGMSRVKLLERATQTAYENYQAQIKDYKLGLVTNLDVLQAITSWHESLRALDALKFQAKLDFVKLETSAALRPSAQTLQAIGK
ncbi:TolC family protein [bacterium]|nr:TolC family protein [bacterium]